MAILHPHGLTLSVADNDSSIGAPQLLARLVVEAEKAGASDIHLHMQGDHALVRVRLDGVLTTLQPIANPLAERVFGRIKYLARLKTYQDSLPQEGRIERAAIGLQNDLRVATYPTVTGEKIVLRLFHSAPGLSLEKMGFLESVRDELIEFLQQNGGLLLLTGPAGSGKTTTIYGCLRHLSCQGGKHVITVEDPVEQVVEGVMQTEVNENLGLTFAEASRHLLRQDPEVLVIGEIRDEETAKIAVRAALTGHLTISTLHAGSCMGVVERLMAMCPDNYAVLSALSLIINQRLVRRLCIQCQGKGCEECWLTGYRGRLPIAEWTKVDDDLSLRIKTNGMKEVQPPVSLAEAARMCVESGYTDTKEIQRILGL